ncbi:hypothetical protein AAULR_01345 [Lacticaseibacillus rhamnosus MTCC 5462]|nr:hypothetical protein AAULR_01345 [Lacticaseibacillus rhamnosus MTCC 5462]
MEAFDMPAEVQLAEGLVDRLGQPQSKVKLNMATVRSTRAIPQLPTIKKQLPA